MKKSYEVRIHNFLDIEKNIISLAYWHTRLAKRVVLTRAQAVYCPKFSNTM